MGVALPTLAGLVLGIIALLASLHVKVGFLSFLGAWGIGGAVGILISTFLFGIFILFVIQGTIVLCRKKRQEKKEEVVEDITSKNNQLKEVLAGVISKYNKKERKKDNPSNNRFFSTRGS